MRLRVDWRSVGLVGMCAGMFIAVLVLAGLVSWQQWHPLGPDGDGAGLILGSSSGKMRTVVVDGELNVLADHKYTDLSSVTNFTDGGTFTIPANAYLAYIDVFGQNVRWRAKGTDPTATTGHQIAAGDKLWYVLDLQSFEVIEEAGGAEMFVSFIGL